MFSFFRLFGFVLGARDGTLRSRARAMSHLPVILLKTPCYDNITGRTLG